MVKISVLMSVYNECDEWLSQSIDSILFQTYTDFEFIIVNDNPTDERINRILSDYAKRDRRIRIVTNERNMGLVYSLNHGLEYVQGEYVARMDADDISHPDRFKKQLDYINKNNCDIISAYVNTINESGIIRAPGINYALSPQVVSDSLRWSNIVPHPCMFVKADVYKALGGYRSVYAAEDYDFLLRAKEKGLRIGMADDILIDYRVRDESISGKNQLLQFIALCYLGKHSGSVCKLDPEIVNRIVSSQVNERSNAAFIKAKEYIRIASKASKAKMLIYVLKGLLTSRYAWKYLYYVVKRRRIKKGAK